MKNRIEIDEFITGLRIAGASEAFIKLITSDNIDDNLLAWELSLEDRRLRVYISGNTYFIREPLVQEVYKYWSTVGSDIYHKYFPHEPKSTKAIT